MRVLRSTLFADPEHAPLHTVVRDSDIETTLEDARAQLDDRAKGALSLHEIFEVPEGTDIRDATMRAGERMDPMREKQQAILFFFAKQMLGILSAEGVWAAPDPAPLTREEITVVLEQVVELDEYQNQTLQQPATDGTLVIVKNGQVQD